MSVGWLAPKTECGTERPFQTWVGGLNLRTDNLEITVLGPRHGCVGDRFSRETFPRLGAGVQG